MSMHIVFMVSKYIIYVLSDFRDQIPLKKQMSFWLFSSLDHDIFARENKISDKVFGNIVSENMIVQMKIRK